VFGRGCGFVTVFLVVFGVFGVCAAPAAGVQAQRLPRSEDERPGGWRGWRNTDRAGSGRVWEFWSIGSGGFWCRVGCVGSECQRRLGCRVTSFGFVWLVSVPGSKWEPAGCVIV